MSSVKEVQEGYEVRMWDNAQKKRKDVCNV